MTNQEPPVFAQPVRRLYSSKPIGTPVRSRHEPLRDMASVVKDKEMSTVSKVLCLAVLGALFAATVYAKFAIFH